MSKDVRCEYSVARARLEGSSLSKLARDAPVEGNLTCIPEQRARSAKPLDLSWRRGGIALLAAVSVADESSSD
jgi:hypothetical protein